MSFTFIRAFFLCFCILSFAVFTSSEFLNTTNWITIAIGIIAGASFGITLILIEAKGRQFNIRSFNTAALGVFFGYLVAQTILLILQQIADADILSLPIGIFKGTKMAIILCCVYFGMMMLLRASEDIYISVPFLRFQPKNEKKKDLILDSSVLLDSRIIDLSTSGIFDNYLIIPRFYLSDLYEQSENGEENEKAKARRCLEIIKKLESIPGLNLRFVDTDFPEIKEQLSKLVHLALLLEANIITTDISRVQQSTIKGIKIINLNDLSNALKPLTHAGEFLNIKIQRYGKEARQGVGYLDDGTMVVVNGGADFIGDVIRTQVLSVKPTSSGRMIFCNACEESENCQDEEEKCEHSPIKIENPNKSYFAL